MKRYRIVIGVVILCGLIGSSWTASAIVRAVSLSVRIDPASTASERGRRLSYSANSSNLLRAAGEPQLDPALPVISEDQASPVRARGLGASEHLPKAERTGPQKESAATRAPTIDRTVGSVQLRMTVEEFQKAVKSSDQTGLNPGLIEDERSFEIARESLVPEIRAVGCRFLHGRLYRITVEYREGAFDETRWDALVKKNMERYGKVPIQSQTLGERPIEFIQWDDPKTRLLLQREHRMRFESKQLVKRYGVVMILLDQALWNERQEAEGSLF